MSSSSEVPVVNLDVIVEDLGTPADLALRGSARVDADKVLAVLFSVFKLKRPHPSFSPCKQITVPYRRCDEICRVVQKSQL
jgi:hypothetical protein